MIYQDERFYLPNLYTFQNGNTFYGSYRGLRFRVTPQVEKGENGEMTGTLSGVVWQGEKCLEESEPFDETVKELSETGYQALLDWLDRSYIQMTSS